VKVVNDGGMLWIAAVNLIIWTGLFFYLLRLDRKISQREKDS
jgi:CcmD family protein